MLRTGAPEAERRLEPLRQRLLLLRLLHSLICRAAQEPYPLAGPPAAAAPHAPRERQELRRPAAALCIRLLCRRLRLRLRLQLLRAG